MRSQDAVEHGVFLVLICLVTSVAAEQPMRAPRGTTQQAAKAANEFAFSLYRQMAPREGNLSLCPMTVYAVMGMAREGVGSKTAEQLGQGSSSGPAGLQAHRAIGMLLPSVGRFDEARPPLLDASNALWIQEGFPVGHKYMQRLKTDFGAEAFWRESQLLQGLEGANSRVDYWTASRTQAHVPFLFLPDERTKATRAILASTALVRWRWSAGNPGPSERQQLAREDTHGVGTEDGGAGTLHGEPVLHLDAGDCDVYDLSSAEGHVSAVFVIPKEGVALGALEARLTQPVFDDWMANLVPAQASPAIPVLDLGARDRLKLGSALRGLGFGSLFTGGEADLTEMAQNSSLFLSDTWHKLHVQITADGGVAAAASVARIADAPDYLGDRWNSRPSYAADRALLLILRHRQSGVILFICRTVGEAPDRRGQTPASAKS
jgi:serine protease inhibitor